MNFLTFLAACSVALLFSLFLDKLRPKFKAFGLRWTYHAQAFFEVHFWQIDDIKRRDLKKRKPVQIIEVSKKDTPQRWQWKVDTQNVETLRYTTTEINMLESENE